MSTKLISRITVILLVVYTLCLNGVNGLCTQTVKRGSRGECVKVLQKAVGVTADGIFGRNTDNAVRSFQRQKRLEVDGIVGRNTWAAINNAGAASSASRIATTGGKTNNCGCGSQSASGDSKGPTPGAKNLLNHVLSKFGGSSLGIYNPRNTRGGTRPSLHSEGRAVDWSPGSRAVFDYLVEIACGSGIQEVIYNKRIWTASGGEKPYLCLDKNGKRIKGCDLHTTHLHVGLNRCGAQNFNK